jgi:hypothetical protein
VRRRHRFGPPSFQAVARCIDAAAGGRVELRQRLLAGILLTGDAGGTRGLAGLVERRVAAIVAAQPLQGVGLAAVQVGRTRARAWGRS